MPRKRKSEPQKKSGLPGKPSKPPKTAYNDNIWFNRDVRLAMQCFEFAAMNGDGLTLVELIHFPATHTMQAWSGDAPLAAMAAWNLIEAAGWVWESWDQRLDPSARREQVWKLTERGFAACKMFAAITDAGYWAGQVTLE